MPYAPEGHPETAKYIVVAEAPAKVEIVYGRPLQGPSGKLFDSCLNMAGIARAQCYITNVFDVEVAKTKDGKQIKDFHGNALWSRSGGFTSEGLKHTARLKGELDACTTATCILALGAPASDALGGVVEIGKHRGSVYRTNLVDGKKFIPCYHPAAALRMYIWRYLIQYDMKRLRKEGEFQGLRRPQYEFTLRPTFREAELYLNDLIYRNTYGPIAVDIEVTGRQTSAICFTKTDLDVMSIVFDDYTLDEEHALWMLIAKVLEDPTIEKIFHNRMFDVWFLLTQNYIKVQGKIHDTMLMQHIMYPDFSKGLAFCTSIYTDQPYYKDMVSHKGIAKADG